MAPKIRPTRVVPRFEKYNCTGKLRVVVNGKAGEIDEIILLPKRGGCKTLLQTVGRLCTAMLECNIDPAFIAEILETVDPCTAPKDRVDFKEGKIKKEELGYGGCSRIIAEALRAKLLPKTTTAA